MTSARLARLAGHCGSPDPFCLPAYSAYTAYVENGMPM
jgi:hypothetical protein